MLDRRRFLKVSFAVPALIRGPGVLGAEDAYVAEIQEFRRKREASLKAEDGWLSVAGLHWLHQGPSRIGSDPACDVLLPQGAPPYLGTLTLEGARASFRAADPSRVTCRKQPFTDGEIRSDAEGAPDVLAAGAIRLILLKRGTRYALRVKDNDSPLRNTFAGLRWYPIDETWKLTAKFVSAPANTRLIFDTIVGEQEVSDSPGLAIFERDGKSYKLQAAKEPDGSLWFVFRDGTSGRTTAGGARQLIVPAPRGDTLVLDFNRAINFPCAYIPFATCPLAPPQNRLSLPITAGELKYEPAAKAPGSERPGP
jgi:uncharacterized protein (DUF1684 family)